MPSFRTVASVASAQVDDGKFYQSMLYRSTAPTMVVPFRWGDLSVGGGTPKYNAYVGAQTEATQLIGSANNGLFTGGYSGAKNLAEVSIYCPIATTFMLCDYLMFYPLIDGDSTDEQVMDNPVTLPRYTSGEGVQAALICTTPSTAIGSFTMNYTNSEGTAGRVTATQSCLINGTGVLANTYVSSNSATLPFIPLVLGDKGVRSVESFTFVTPPSGFFTLLLYKPLTTVVVPENAQAAEKTFIHTHMALPEIQPGAYLQYLFNTQTTGHIAGTRALHTFIW